MEIDQGIRGPKFIEFIRNVISQGDIKEKYLTVLTTKEYIPLYSQAMTAFSGNALKNYEIFEQLGDLVINKFIVNYTYNRFPHLRKSPDDVKTTARVRIKYASKEMLSKFAEGLNFWEFITARKELEKGKFEKGIKTKKDHKKDLLEDTFEAFFGCTERILDCTYGTGVGNAVCYSVLKGIFDKIDISLKYEDLYDSKTILKQLFDIRKELGTLRYQDKFNE